MKLHFKDFLQRGEHRSFPKADFYVSLETKFKQNKQLHEKYAPFLAGMSQVFWLDISINISQLVACPFVWNAKAPRRATIRTRASDSNYENHGLYVIQNRVNLLVPGVLQENGQKRRLHKIYSHAEQCTRNRRPFH